MILSIDQSTQGTKALLLDADGKLVDIKSLPHKQYIDDKGYVEHDLDEIYQNVIAVVKALIKSHPEAYDKIAALGLSVQRETVAAFSKKTLKPLYHAIVWQCARGYDLVKKEEIASKKEEIRKITGLELSEYFSAPKMTWLIDNVSAIKDALNNHDLRFGNMDSFLIARLTKGKSFATEPSNASRTMLMDLERLDYSDELLDLFRIPKETLPPIISSDSLFGTTTFDGLFDYDIPIYGAIGDSQGALFGHGCLKSGQVKTTYGTGSSIMMNAGENIGTCKKGIVTSVGWMRENKVSYVLEGNINYSAGIISYLKDDLKLINSPAETQDLALKANPKDKTVFVPALSGLGAPWFNGQVRGSILGMSRLTTKNEIVKAALDSIVLQVDDVLDLIKKSTDVPITELNVDGGATKNSYLMQAQSDISDLEVKVPYENELSGIGAAYLAGIACGLYDESVLLSQSVQKSYKPSITQYERLGKKDLWHKAVNTAMSFAN